MGLRMGNGKNALYSVYINNTGSTCVRLYNQTGVTSIVGQAVKPSTSFNVSVAKSSEPYDCIGAIAESGVAVSSLVWVAYNGVVPVLFEDSKGSLAGDWVQCASGTSGRFEAATGVTGLGALTTDQHFKEAGHCLYTVTAGTSVTCPIFMHFN